MEEVVPRHSVDDPGPGALRQVRVRPKKLTIAPSEIGILKALTP